jgi:hypothetical protein
MVLRPRVGRRKGAGTAGASASPAPPADPSLVIGFAAALPLFLAYELALGLDSRLGRNGAQAALTLPLDLFAPGSAWPRALLVVAAGACALVAIHRRGAGSWHAVARSVAQGFLAGLVLGPLLVLLTRLLPAPPGETLHWDIPARRPDAPPGIVALLRLAGGAGWEELVFRVGLLGLLYLLVFRTAAFLGLRTTLARLAAELLALGGSALVFAAFHLDSVQAKLGLAGDPYRLEVFLWRVLAGIALAVVFRWKGLGVAAWSHALLNVGLALGAGTGIFGKS